MRVTVEIMSLPNLAKMLGARTMTMDFPGGTVADLVRHLAESRGDKVRNFLLGEDGELDMTLRVVLNRRDWLRREDLSRPLAEGDHVAIAMLVGGG